MKIESATLLEITDALRAGSLSAEAIAQHSVHCHELHDAKLNAYISWDDDYLRLQAKSAAAAFDAGHDLGALQGIPISIKDMFGVRGFPLYAGCSNPLPDEWRTEGPIVGSMRRQLSVITGKTHTVQFAYGGLGINQHWGAPRNPWDAKNVRSPGGSSSGAGISLHEGSALIAIGSDTAGSVRIPASATGLSGLRPTWGRWSRKGIVPLAPDLDTAGPLARSVEDLAFAFAAFDPHISNTCHSYIAGLRKGHLSNFRIGVCQWLFDDCDPGVAECVEDVLSELESAGLRASSIEMPLFQQATNIFAQGGLHIGAFSSLIENELNDYKDDLDPIVLERLKVFLPCSASDHLFRKRCLERMARQVTEDFCGVDAIIGPTLPITPPILDDVTDPEIHLKANMKLVRNTNVASLLGLCAITVPVGLDRESMPVGLQICCPPLQEDRALAVALAIERKIGNPVDRLGTPPLLKT